ncbi:MAG: preprotein translocase subunit YajC [Alphaproteobacteria bacterium]|nr:preprotein translocase subunit YajC [Alphaproteobacteria bacterium]
MFISTAYAQTGGGAGGFDIISLMPLVLIFVIFWFFLIRPQQRKAKEHREMVSALKRNDQVLTAGGIFGRVTKLIDDTMVQVEIADNVRVRVARSTISEVMSRTGSAKAAPSKQESKAEQKDDGDGDGEEQKETAKAPAGEESGKKSMFSFGSKK